MNEIYTGAGKTKDKLTFDGMSPTRCSPGPMFPGPDVPQARCSPGPMFPQQAEKNLGKFTRTFFYCTILIVT